MPLFKSPYSNAAERNKTPIFDCLNPLMRKNITVLEIGAGTGQHAIHFCEQRPDITWQPSDRQNNLSELNNRFKQSMLTNILPVMELTISEQNADIGLFDWLYTSNTAHIMSWQEVQWMFKFAGKTLKSQGYFSLYGPFKQNGEHTSQSNAEFEASLKARNASMGLRDIDELTIKGRDNALELLKQFPMPANNQLLLFRRF